MRLRAPPCDAPERSTKTPRFEVADIIRRAVAAGFADRPLRPEQAAVLRAICRCRTASMGGHAHVCRDCGHVDIAYNSCRNRHCPRCQWAAQEAWIEGRMERVLDTHYFHVVFTLPSELRGLGQTSPREIYSLLFQAASRTLLELGREPKWLGAELGITAVLHTWTRDLRFHPHLHCLVTGGGLGADGSWVAAGSNYLVPVQVLGALFRGKFLAGLRSLYGRAKLDLRGPTADLADPDVFARLVDRLYSAKWIVYAKRPMAGPEQVITYLGRYTHRVAISNSRLLNVTDDQVVFRTRGDGTAALSIPRFVERFLLHVLPKRFVKIRHYGLFAAANIHTKWALARAQLREANPNASAEVAHDSGSATDAPRCAVCQGTRVLIVRFEYGALAPPSRGPPQPRLPGGPS